MNEYKAPILGNIVICIGVSILAVELSLKRHFPSVNDYAVYFYASKMFFNPSETFLIYNYEYMNAVYGTVQFRYLPSFLIIWYPLTLVDISTSFCIFNGICICLNVISAFYVIRIVEHHFKLPISQTTKHFMSLILLGLFQAWNYGLGQVMALVLFFVITSLYYFLEGKTAIAGFLLGFSIVVKPVLYFTIFFVVLSAKNIRGKVKAIIAILPSFIVDCIIFLVFPTLLSSLLSRNTADFTFWRIYGSTSLSSLLYLDFNLDPTMVFLGVSIAVVIMGLLVLKSKTWLPSGAKGRCSMLSFPAQ